MQVRIELINFNIIKAKLGLPNIYDLSFNTKVCQILRTRKLPPISHRNYRSLPKVCKMWNMHFQTIRWHSCFKLSIHSYLYFTASTTHRTFQPRPVSTKTILRPNVIVAWSNITLSSTAKIVNSFLYIFSHSSK